MHHLSDVEPHVQNPFYNVRNMIMLEAKIFFEKYSDTDTPWLLDVVCGCTEIFMSSIKN
jgi:hypothetical protein